MPNYGAVKKKNLTPKGRLNAVDNQSVIAIATLVTEHDNVAKVRMMASQYLHNCCYH